MLTQVDSPFEAGDTTPQEAASLTARADLLIHVRDIIEAKGWTQKEAAKVLGVHQPRISDIKTGVISKFSLGMLVEFLIRLGHQFEMTETDTGIHMKLESGDK